MSIFGAEVIGTALLILLGNGVVACVLLNLSKGQNSGWIVITWGWGLAVMVAVFTVGQFSGAQLNPAVTLGFAIEGRTDWGDVPEYLAGEFVGAFIGAVLAWVAYKKHFDVEEDAGAKLAVFSTGPAIRNPLWNMVTEIIATVMLTAGILAITNAGNKGILVSGLATLLVAFLVVGIGLSLGGPTGYAINPARDLGPRIMHAILPIPGKGPSDWGYSWIPVVGPLIGGVIGGLFYYYAWPS